MAKTSSKDFDPKTLVATTESHEKALHELERRVETLERRVGTDSSFASAFETAVDREKKMDDVIFRAIDRHDKHNLKVIVGSVFKRIVWLVIGAAITAVVTIIVSQRS